MKETRPDIVNLSRYSRRPGTMAAEMPQIDVVEIKRRSKQVTDLINDISLENNRKWIGWKGKVLFDENLDGQVNFFLNFYKVWVTWNRKKQFELFT